MDMSFSKEDLEFRDEVRHWLAEAMPAEIKCKAEGGAPFSAEESKQWHQILFEKGWAAPAWPREYGGTGWNATHRFIFSEECIRANAPQPSIFGLAMVGPLLMQYGTDEQKQRFLPKILSGEESWCQGYSEPNAGSDLASLQLRADKSEDDYVLNGQKTWTTLGHQADWIFLLARTSKEKKPQLGITFLLADMKTPGIETKPFLTIGGQPSFCDTFFTDARVPQANRVGDEGDGWTMAKALLGHERTGIGGAGESARWLRLVKRIARETDFGNGRLMDDPSVRRKIAKVEVRLRAIEMANYRTLSVAAAGKAPGPESSILKIVGTELHQEVTELAMDVLGPAALGWFDSPDVALRDHEKMLASEFNYYRACTIYGGSNEIQKNIISKHVLGLPS